MAIESYSYDATGNRQSFTNSVGTRAYTYPSTSHRLSRVGATARTYDNAGNTTAIGGVAREFVYDDTGRMSQVKQNTIVQRNYVYNGKGEQVRKYLGTSNTYTVYDEAGHWLGDYDNTGAAVQQAIWLDDLPVGLIANGNQLHYIEPDHLGTPRVVIEVARNVPVWTWDLKSEAFGNSAPNQDPDGDSNALVFDMRFPGQRYDTASELNYNYFRDYEAATGRYVESDPVGLLGGISTFSYVDATPFAASDRYGLASSPAVCGQECGKARYDSQRKAARAILKAINPVSVQFNLEICGNICKDKTTGKYFKTGPIIGSLSSCDPRKAPCPSCAETVAYWHTHGAFNDSNKDGIDDYDSENFSGTPGDQGFADHYGIDAYLGTPSGQFWGYQSGGASPPTNWGKL